MNKTIKNSLLLQLTGFALFIVLFLLAAYGITNSYSNQMMRNNTLKLNEKILLQLEGKVDEFHSSMDHIATSFVYSPTVYKYFFMNSLERIISMEDVSAVFSNTVLLEENIVGAYLYDAYMNQIASLGKVLDSQELICKKRDRMEVSNMFYMKESGFPYYLIYYPVYDLNNQQYGIQTGTCVFVMKIDNFMKMLEDSQATEHAQVFLIDQNYKVLASRGNQGVALLNTSMIKSTRAYNVQVHMLRMDGWKVVSRISEQELRSGSDGLKGFVTFAYVLAFLMIGMLALFCYRRLVYPMRKVDSFIINLRNNPDSRLEAEREDEIGTVVRSLNQMLDDQQKMNREIQISQKKMYEAEVMKKQLQLLAYQNQINPHFLYNTFECIRAMALYHEVEDIAEITIALSHVFRFAVKGESMVSVNEEVSYIKEYAKIIYYRFMGKIGVVLDVEKEVSEKHVIKLMLQPLVENAVFHGLEMKVEGGEVIISISMFDEDHIIFVVEDNGCGIEPDKLLLIREMMDSQANQEGIGIANIYQRLKLFYEDEMKFRIESEVNKGTKITIIVPDDVNERIERHV